MANKLKMSVPAATKAFKQEIQNKTSRGAWYENLGDQASLATRIADQVSTAILRAHVEEFARIEVSCSLDGVVLTSDWMEDVLPYRSYGNPRPCQSVTPWTDIFPILKRKVRDAVWETKNVPEMPDKLTAIRKELTDILAQVDEAMDKIGDQ